MKFIIVGDLHFKSNNGKYTQQLQVQLQTILEAQAVDYVILLGDVIDTFETSSCQVLSRVTQFICMLTAQVKHVYVLVGNHDRGKEDGLFATSTTLAMLQTCPQVTLVLQTTVVNLQGLKLVCVPYVDPGRFPEALKHVGYDYTPESLAEIRLVVAHQEFKGAKLGANISEIGDNWPETHPLCISGHIHDSHWVNSKLYYTGTPMAHGHAEVGPKNVCLLDLDAKDYNLSVIPLNVGRRFTITKSVQDLIDYRPPINCNVRIRVVATTEVFKQLHLDPRLAHLQIPEISFKRLNPVSDSPLQMADVDITKFWDSYVKLIGQQSAGVKQVCKEVLNIPIIRRLRRM